MMAHTGMRFVFPRLLAEMPGWCGANRDVLGRGTGEVVVRRWVTVTVANVLAVVLPVTVVFDGAEVVAIGFKRGAVVWAPPIAVAVALGSDCLVEVLPLDGLGFDRLAEALLLEEVDILVILRFQSD